MSCGNRELEKHLFRKMCKHLFEHISRHLFSEEISKILGNSEPYQLE
jgi:hypothetical protein